MGEPGTSRRLVGTTGCMPLMLAYITHRCWLDAFWRIWARTVHHASAARSKQAQPLAVYFSSDLAKAPRLTSGAPCIEQEEYIKEEQRSLKRELLRAQEEVKRIQSVPLVIGQFLEMVDGNSGIVGSTTGTPRVALERQSVHPRREALAALPLCLTSYDIETPVGFQCKRGPA